MKLFSRYNKINLAATIGIFLLMSVAYYFILQYILVNEIDDDLVIEQTEIESYIKRYEKLPDTLTANDMIIAYLPATSVLKHRKFSNISIVEQRDTESEPFRKLSFTINVSGRFYTVSISKSLEGTEKLSRLIILVTSITLLLILIVSLVINRMILRKLWRPFYSTLNTIHTFRIGEKQQLKFPQTNIEEFNLLNEKLNEAIRQAEKDYITLKEFTENASHEMQTPLSIIRAKLDMLIQDEALTESQSKTVLAAYQSIEKLSNLNKSLLLLAKIENRQYHTQENIDIKKMILSKLQDFQELWQAKGITQQSSMEDGIRIQMNPELADILLNNLLSNATTHNYEGGKITITLHSKSLTISNTSRSAALQTVQFNSRFYKSAMNSESNGLGLSITKQICEVSGFTIGYYFKDEWHHFKIHFK